MNWSKISIAVSMVLVAGATVALAQPQPLDLVPGQTGLGVFYNTDGSASPEEWGRLRQGGGGIVANGYLEVGGPNQFLDYDPTTDLDQGTSANIPGTGDWAFTLDWEVLAHVASTRIFEMGSQLNDIARVVSTGTPDEYTLSAGDGSGSYATIGNFTTSAGGFHNLYLFHDGTDNLFDFYVDDVLQFSDFRARVDSAPVEFRTVRIHGSGTLGSNRYDNIMASANFAAPPVYTAATGIAAGNFPGVEWVSDFDKPVYTLESNSTPPTNAWVDTGGRVEGVTGEASTLVMFDPNGANPSNSYRILRTSSRAPDPELDPAQPGCQAPYNVDDSLAAEDWGLFAGALGSWTVSNGTASATGATNSTPRLLYRVTDMGSTNATTMNVADGWVAAMRFSYEGSVFAALNIEAPGSYEFRCFGPASTGETNAWRFDFRDSLCGTISDNFILEENVPHEILYHYSGSASNLLDLWVDGTRIFNDFPLEICSTSHSGPFHLQTLQIGGGNPYTGTLNVEDVVVAPFGTGAVEVATISDLYEAIEVAYESETGKVYNLEIAEDLTAADAFLGNTTTIEGNGATQRFYNVTEGKTQKSYRVLEVP